MLEKYSKEIGQLTDWYAKAKAAAIRAESMDPTRTSFIQPLHEQRYSYDHFMRAVDYDAEEGNEELVKKALNAAVGHLQRAYSDAVEWMLVSVKDEYSKTLEQYTNAQIAQAFPEYYQTIKTSLTKITKAVDEYKINKGIEKTTAEIELSEEELKKIDATAKEFLSLDVVNTLINHRDELYIHESALVEVSKKDKKGVFKDKYLIPIITGVVSGIVVLILTLLLSA